MGVFVEKPGPAVRFQREVGDLHLGQELFYLGTQGDQRSGFGLGVQRREHDLVAAAAVFDSQAGIGGIPGRGAPPRRIQTGGELVNDGGRVRVEGQFLAQRVAPVGPFAAGEQFGAGIAPPGAAGGVDVAAAQPGADLVEHAAGVGGAVDGAGLQVVHMRSPRRCDHLQRNFPGGPPRGAGLAGQPLAERVVGGQHRSGRVDGLQLDRLDQPGQEPADLRVSRDQPLIERIPGRAHQRLHRAHVRLDPLALCTELRQHLLKGGRVVEGIQQRAHLRVHRGDRLVVVAELAGAAFLAAVGGSALQVPEHDVEDVDHIVAGAGGQQVCVGDKRGDPPLRSQVGQLGGPGLVGVAGQGHQSGGGYPRQVQLAGSKGPNSLQAVQCTHQSGDRGRERRAPQQIQQAQHDPQRSALKVQQSAAC